MIIVLLPAGKDERPVRDRGDVDSATLRKPESLPPTEIRHAITAIVRVHLGASTDEVVTETSGLFGFRSELGRQLRSRLQSLFCAGYQ